MPEAKRVFRGKDSITAELVSRNAVGPFLTERGFDVLEDKRNVAGTAIEQFVTAKSPEGQLLKMRVRICWRREGRNASERAREFDWGAYTGKARDYLAQLTGSGAG